VLSASNVDLGNLGYQEENENSVKLSSPSFMTLLC